MQLCRGLIATYFSLKDYLSPLSRRGFSVMRPEMTDTLSNRYEAGFCVFMGALAFLGRDNPSLEYPAILHLFGVLMVLNLLAGIALRRRPDAPMISTGFILANCGVITAILAYSGGASSNLWVLYLLPIFTVCLLLGPRETVFITVGVVAFNAVFTLGGT